MTPSETLKTRASRLTGFLGLQRNTVGVLAMVVLVGMGERMAERFLPIYMMGPWGWCAGHGQPALGPLLISGGYLVVTACMLTMLTVMVWVYQNFYYTLDILYI